MLSWRPCETITPLSMVLSFVLACSSTLQFLKHSVATWTASMAELNFPGHWCLLLKKLNYYDHDLNHLGWKPGKWAMGALGFLTECCLATELEIFLTNWFRQPKHPLWPFWELNNAFSDTTHARLLNIWLYCLPCCNTCKSPLSLRKSLSFSTHHSDNPTPCCHSLGNQG